MAANLSYSATITSVPTGVGLSSLLPAASLATTVNPSNAGHTTARIGPSGINGNSIAGIDSASAGGVTARPSLSTPHRHGLSHGDVAGIALGACALVLGLVMLIGTAWVKNNRRRRAKETARRTSEMRNTIEAYTKRHQNGLSNV